MVDDLLHYVLLGLMPLVPAGVIFLWRAGSSSHRAARRLRQAMVGYCCSSILAALLSYILAATLPADGTAMAQTVAALPSNPPPSGD